jgi:hypothetical protein
MNRGSTISDSVKTWSPPRLARPDALYGALYKATGTVIELERSLAAARLAKQQVIDDIAVSGWAPIGWSAQLEKNSA